MSRTAGQVALLTAGVIATGALGYAVYFDYMRRNSPDFRRKLRKQAQKVQEEADRKQKVHQARQKLQLRAVIREIATEDVPTTPEAQEAYFQEQVAIGERLATQGAEMHVTAASHFYRALRVYPQPVELLMIYQKVVPAPIFALVIEFTQQAPGIAPTSGPASNPLAALGAAAGINVAPPRSEASVTDIDSSISASASASAPSSSDAQDKPFVHAPGEIPTDEEIEAIIAAASGQSAKAAEEDDDEEEEEEEEEDEGQSTRAESATSGASWEKVE